MTSGHVCASRTCRDIPDPGPGRARKGGAATCPSRPDGEGEFTRWPRPRPHFRGTAITCPAPPPRTGLRSCRASLPPEVGRLSLSGYGSPSGGGGPTGSLAAAAAAAAMAELVQGQSAPVGMKAEGFVDALHRVRQVRARPAGGSAGAEAGPGPARGGAGGRAWAGRQLGPTPPSGLTVPGGSCSREEQREEAPREA